MSKTLNEILQVREYSNCWDKGYILFGQVDRAGDNPQLLVGEKEEVDKVVNSTLLMPLRVEDWSDVYLVQKLNEAKQVYKKYYNLADEIEVVTEWLEWKKSSNKVTQSSEKAKPKTAEVKRKGEEDMKEVENPNQDERRQRLIEMRQCLEFMKEKATIAEGVNVYKPIRESLDKMNITTTVMADNIVVYFLEQIMEREIESGMSFTEDLYQSMKSVLGEDASE